MLKFKKYFIFSGIVILFYLLISLLYLISNISYNVISSIILIFNLLFFMIIGFVFSKKSKQKGIIIGLKISSIIVIILLTLTLIFRFGFNTNNIIYYLLIMLSTIFGAVISKNIKN